MSETQKNLDSFEQARPSDASFFIGRGGLRLPSGFRTEPDLDSPVQPITNTFEALEAVWSLNGHEIGRVAREDTIALPATDTRPALILGSQYRGWSDEELLTADLGLHGRGGTRPVPGIDSLHQGVEVFSIALPDTRPLDKDGEATSGRASIVASKTHRYKLSESEVAGWPPKPGHETAGSPSAPDVEPDPDNESLHIFLGSRRIYPDFALTGRQTLRVFADLQLPEELGSERKGPPPTIESYQMWLSHFTIGKLLSED